MKNEFQEVLEKNNSKKENMQLWLIPINYATKSAPEFNRLGLYTWLKLKVDYFNERSLKANDWFILNKEASYHYLVNYDNKNWNLIAKALNSQNFGKIPPLTRAKLLHDAFILAEYRKLNYSIALQLIKYLPRETDYIVLTSFFCVFNSFYNKFSELENFHYLQVRIYLFPVNIITKMETLDIYSRRSTTNFGISRP